MTGGKLGKPIPPPIFEGPARYFRQWPARICGASSRFGVPVNRLAKWKTTIQMFAIGFLMVGEAGPENFPTVLIGDAGLWIAAALTLMTGYDYLRAGLRHIEAEDSAESPNQVSGAE